MNLKKQWMCCSGSAGAEGEAKEHAADGEAVAAGGWRQAAVQANWRMVGLLTLSVTCVAFGIFILIHGFDMLRHLWVLGPILILIGLAILVAAFIIKKKPTDEEMLNEKYRQCSENEALEAEQEAVPMEPVVILLT